MSEFKEIDTRLIPEVNVGTLGHVDHGKCIALDEFLLTNNKILIGEELKALAENNGSIFKKENEEIFYQLNDFHTYSLSNNFTIKRMPALIFTQPYNGFMYKVCTVSGREIKTTPNHPFLVSSKGEIKWKLAKELTGEDQIGVVKKLTIEPNVEFNLNFISKLSERYKTYSYQNFIEIKNKTRNFAFFDNLSLDDWLDIIFMSCNNFSSIARKLNYSSNFISDVFGVRDRKLSKNLKKGLEEYFSKNKPSIEEDEIIAIDIHYKNRIAKFRDPKEFDSNLAKWFALLHSEGTSSENRLAVSQSIYPEVIEEFQRITKSKFGLEFKKVSDDDWQLNCRAFVQYIKAKYSFKIGNVRKSPICDWMIGINEDAAKDFLKWFITLEGDINPKSGQIVVTQANKTDINTLCFLLLRFEIFSHLGKCYKYATNTKNRKIRQYYSLSISGRDNIEKYLNKIGLLDAKKITSMKEYLNKIKKISKSSNLSISIDFKILKNICNSIGLSKDKIRSKSWFYAFNKCRNINRISIEKLREFINDIKSFATDIDTLMTLNELSLLCTDTICFDKIKSIDKFGYDGHVIDLSVPKYHNFISGFGGIISHNSTLVQAISGKWPSVHSEELKRGITIKLGYADATIYKCMKCNIFCATDKCPKCFEVCEPQRTISFVDSPGHETLMATVLAGASLMDGILFVIAANEKCPQPQTREHLMVLNIVGIKNIIIVQTKIDVVSREQALENYKQIKEFVKGTVAENAPIIPVSSQNKVNIDSVLEAIQNNIPTPQRDLTKPPRMLIARSFDINKPGTEVEDLKGGVVGGSLIQGELKINDEIEIKPGYLLKSNWVSLKTKVVGLQKAGKNLEKASSGGLLGVMTELDTNLTKADYLSGSVAGINLPPILEKLTLKFDLFEKLFEEKIEPIRKGEQIMLNVGTSRTIGTVSNVKKDVVEIELKLPVCADKGDRVVLSRKIAERWRLIGYSEIV